MAIFEYKGVGPDGKQSKGTVEADSSRTARQKLKSRGIYTTDLKERSLDSRSGSGVRSSSGGQTTVKLKSLT
ncbi:hypothetical protein EBQ90_02800 [bacterium]|nr:hypothetical protein [bacterium]